MSKPEVEEPGYDFITFLLPIFQFLITFLHNFYDLPENSENFVHFQYPIIFNLMFFNQYHNNYNNPLIIFMAKHWSVIPLSSVQTAQDPHNIIEG